MSRDEAPQPIPTAANLAALKEANHLWDVFAELRSVKELKTQQNKPYMLLELADVHSVLEARIWSEHEAAMRTAAALAPRTLVKARGQFTIWKGRPQFVIHQLRALGPDERPDGFDLSQVVDPALAAVEDLACETLVFDIETVPCCDLRDLPPGIVESLSTSANRKDMEPGALMGLSPFFGKIVSLAVADGETARSFEDVSVFAVPPEGLAVRENPPWLRLVEERDLLRYFWALASRAETIVTFNGRGFDVPFLVTRSLIHGIPARVDLVSNRFSLRPHLDLYELLTQRDRGPSKLDVVCWALDIESPKQSMSGAEVAPAYAQGRIAEIAEYNAHDVRATCQVYQRVRDMILRYRSDWPGR
ncbi:MAG: hypothetical protein Fur0037_14430 [Planctomycetota bacterium]